MMLDNDNILFEIPNLSYEWQHRGIIYFDSINNKYLLLKEEVDNFVYLCRITIFHTKMGDIHTFTVNCPDLSNESNIFKNTIAPIFEKYCSENIIELKFDNLKND